MQLVHFPGCCTAQVLVGFGQSDTAALGYRPHREYTEETFYNEAKRLLEQAGRHNYATVIAITNSDQTTAMKVLPKLGFVLVQQEIGKRQHEDKTLNTYVYTVTGADKKPLPVPANPFVKPAPVKVHLAVRQRDGAIIPVHRVVVNKEMIEEYRMGGHNGEVRKQVNDGLFRNNQRDAQGRFVAQVPRGVPLTRDQVLAYGEPPENIRFAELVHQDAGYVIFGKCRAGAMPFSGLTRRAPENRLYVIA